jgi:hypothetical protein
MIGERASRPANVPGPSRLTGVLGGEEVRDRDAAGRGTGEVLGDVSGAGDDDQLGVWCERLRVGSRRVGLERPGRRPREAPVLGVGGAQGMGQRRWDGCGGPELAGDGGTVAGDSGRIEWIERRRADSGGRCSRRRSAPRLGLRRCPTGPGMSSHSVAACRPWLRS